MNVLERYSYLKISKYIKEYLALEEFEAHKRADNRVAFYLKQYKMKDIENLNDSIKSVITDKIKEMLDSKSIDSNPKFREIQNNIIQIYKGKYNGKIFIKAPTRVFETILKNSVSESEYKKMKYKLNSIDDIIKIIADYRAKSTKINDSMKSIKGLIIDIDDEKKEDSIIRELSEDGNLIIEGEKQILNN